MFHFLPVLCGGGGRFCSRQETLNTSHGRPNGAEMCSLVRPAPGHGELGERPCPWAAGCCPDGTEEGGWQARGLDACPEDTRGGNCQ